MGSAPRLDIYNVRGGAGRLYTYGSAAPSATSAVRAGRPRRRWGSLAANRSMAVAMTMAGALLLLCVAVVHLSGLAQHLVRFAANRTLSLPRVLNLTSY